MAKKKVAHKAKATAKAAKSTAAPASVKDKAAAARKKVAEHAAAKVVTQNPLSRKVAGFAEFIREKGVVGLAVGLAFGTAATVFVKQIVDSVITPAVGLLVGEKGLEAWNITIKIGDRSGDFAFGTLANGFLQFMAVAAVIYFVVMGLKLERLDKKKED